jgi:hypothetical protein
MVKAHHLTAHWVDEDEGRVVAGAHHHLTEHWVDEEEDLTESTSSSAPETPSGT